MDACTTFVAVGVGLGDIKKYRRVRDKLINTISNSCEVFIRIDVACMLMSRAPRQLLTSLVAHSRPVGCPQMTWGRTLENALKRKGISKEFCEWFAIAKDRSKWRQLTHSNPKPPDA